jgi:CheY-like chemotaxis protein
MFKQITGRSLRQSCRSSSEPGIEQFEGRVLVVDDCSGGRKMISGILQCMGLHTAVAENGRAACHKALLAWQGGQPFSLILMDVGMPEIDGCEATGLLRAMGYDGRIVGLTGNRFDETRERCLEAGCDDQAEKPITSEMLANVLRRNLPAARESGPRRMRIAL